MEPRLKLQLDFKIFRIFSCELRSYWEGMISRNVWA